MKLAITGLSLYRIRQALGEVKKLFPGGTFEIHAEGRYDNRDLQPRSLLEVRRVVKFKRPQTEPAKK